MSARLIADARRIVEWYESAPTCFEPPAKLAIAIEALRESLDRDTGANAPHAYELEVLRYLRQEGVAFKLRVCSCGHRLGMEECEPCRNPGSTAHLFTSHTICEECAEAAEHAPELTRAW